MDFLNAIVLGIVEGLTEFLPVSSTGHLLVASAVLAFPPASYRLSFDIFIQIGAVVAVLAYYARDLFSQARQLPTDRSIQRFWLNILIAFLPAAVVGLAVENQLDAFMATPNSSAPSLVIAVALIVGGIIFLLVERGERTGSVHALTEVSTRQALWIGLAQVTSLIPGISRSGASIVGGLLAGLDRVTATAFSFYLFIPTLGAATLYKLYSAFRDHLIVVDQLPLFLVAAFVALVVSYASIAWLLRFVAHHDFKLFGYYRISAGAVIIVLALFTPLLAQ